MLNFKSMCIVSAAFCTTLSASSEEFTGMKVFGTDNAQQFTVTLNNDYSRALFDNGDLQRVLRRDENPPVKPRCFGTVYHNNSIFVFVDFPTQMAYLYLHKPE